MKAAAEDKLIYTPEFFRLNIPAEKKAFDDLRTANKHLFEHDEIYSQLRELIKSQNPSVRIKNDEYESRITNHLGGAAIREYGVWVYYPWSRRLIHLLDEDEFIEVRTNRNQYKITKDERSILGKKKIGIVGLSVGHSIALTLSMERGFGELRLADFDTLELSNLNRIKTGLHNMGIPKVVIAAREIAEIDPFLNVRCFFDGLTEANMDAFFTGNGKLDLLVDECDGLDIKIISRLKARELKIPVVMDTSDRGMLDVERFDLEPDRPILHGTVQSVNPETIKELTNEEKIPVILQMLGVENLSLRAKASMVEVEQSINTWPQLGSSVTLGGAVGADVCRRILLDQFHQSGRYYIDLEELIPEKGEKAQQSAAPVNPFYPLSDEAMRVLINGSQFEKITNCIIPEPETIRKLIHSACAAPSTGNDQPWKWLYDKGTLYLFHDEYRSFSFGDFQKMASFISLGAAYENLYIAALALGIEPILQFLPNRSSEKLVAAINFRQIYNTDESFFLRPLSKKIYERATNRNSAPKVTIPLSTLNILGQFAESMADAKVLWFTDEDDLAIFAKIIGACDRIRLLNKAGHYDFVHREMRWTKEDADSSKDGIDIRTLGLSNSQLAALSVIKDENVINALKGFDGGRAFDMLAKQTVANASALCMITLPEYNLRNFFEGGRSMERLWLAATDLNLAVHPLISPFYLFPRITHSDGEGLDPESIIELNELRDKFVKLTGLDDNRAEIFLTKIAVAPKPVVKTQRLPIEKVLTIIEH
ncbi:Rv1355c family protein [Mucilaginibacter ginsenosidivorans]|uniref:Rv1355c family protein n=1 Tax=Mucilaginibacter ginsenosidivorans TaxID=398053 RepID=A0A5B8UZY0_9SPHI|nr:Rv1355c family protein [Mucilaginibacter ginsenosidivorans]QEC64335.1 Rv1355c family protein [Mucilaginibacter ginsenosidivorans]